MGRGYSAIVTALALALCGRAEAASLAVAVSDQDGRPVANAVVSLISDSKNTMPSAAAWVKRWVMWKVVKRPSRSKNPRPLMRSPPPWSATASRTTSRRPAYGWPWSARQGTPPRSASTTSCATSRRAEMPRCARSQTLGPHRMAKASRPASADEVLR